MVDLSAPAYLDQRTTTSGRSSTTTLDREELADVEPPLPPPDESRGASEADRRRFVAAVVIGIAIAMPFFLWILWGGHFDPFRTYIADRTYFDNFFDMQARALFHGHWYLRDESLGIEGFMHNGHTYTYFSPFPSIIRVPVLLVTSRFDGRLTAPSMLLAWLTTGLFLSLLLWRVRVLMRGGVALGRREAASYGALVLGMMGGSVILYLAASPYVYNEDIAWGVALCMGALLGLLGVLERPSLSGIAQTGALILAVNLSRTTLGWACVIGAVMVSYWFGSGRGGPANQRWWRLVLAAGVIPLLAGSYVTQAKFGIPFGLPMSNQVWTQISEQRRQVLAASGGKAFSVGLLPSNLFAYFRPDGLRFTPVFPFITLPAAPPRALFGGAIDMLYRSASIPSSMPLLFGLSIWGMLTVFRPKPLDHAKIFRIILLTAGAGAVGVAVWGYIAERYLADFYPLLCVASMVGLIDLWRRCDSRRPRPAATRRRHHFRRPLADPTLAVVTLALFGLAANVGLATTPSDAAAWPPARVSDYVRVQEALSKLTGNPVAENVMRGKALPDWAPADKLFILNNCAGLFISSGESYHTWIPVAFGPGLRYITDVTFRQPAGGHGRIPLVDIGQNLVSKATVDYESGHVRVSLDDPLYAVSSPWQPIKPGRTYRVTADVDNQTHTVTLMLDGKKLFDSLLSTGEPNVRAHVQRPQPPAAQVTIVPVPTPVPALCRELQKF